MLATLVEPMSFDLTRWSHSALALLQDCGEAFRRRYIENERRPMTLRRVRGTVVHTVAHRALYQKWKRRALPTATEARDLAADEFEACLRQGVSFEPDDLAMGAARAQGHAKDFAVGLSAYHVSRIAPLIQPVAVEQRIVVKPQDADITIVGKLDLIEQHPGGRWVRDLKTSEKSPAKTAAEKSQQLTMYSLLEWANKGAMPERLALDYAVRTPKGQEKHVPLFTTRSLDDVGTLVNRINTAVEAVKKGIFVPANPDSWKCDPRYCDYFDSCPYVRRGSRPES